MKVRIQNFQSYEDTTFHFPSGITCITGPSDVGKSAALRSIEWLANNRPNGDKMRRHDTKKTQVTIGEVSKVKTKSKHYYTIGDQTFKAIRSSVPDEVRGTLGLSEVNFQGQHSAYFLIADSPGQVARTLNKVADLQIIDASLKAMRGKVKQGESEYTNTLEDLKEVKEKLKEKEWVPLALKIKEDILKTRESHEKIREEIRTLKSKVQRAREAQKTAAAVPLVSEDLQTLTGMQQALSDAPDLSQLRVTIKSVKAAEENQVHIENIGQDKEEVRAEISTLTDAQDHIKAIKTAVGEMKEIQTIPDIMMEDVRGPLLEAKKAVEKLRLTITDVKECKEKADEAIHNLFHAKHDFAEWKESFPVCPFCGEEI